MNGRRQISSALVYGSFASIILLLLALPYLEDQNRPTVLLDVALSLVAFLLLILLYRATLRERDERRRAEGALEDLRHRSAVLNSVLLSMSDGVAVVDLAGRFLHTNPAADALLGRPHVDTEPSRWSAEFEFLTPDGAQLYPPEELPLARAMRGESSDDVPVMVRRPGESALRQLEGSGRPLLTESGERIGGMVVFRDVTERIRAEAERLRSAAEVEDLYNCAPCGYHSLGPDGTFLRINDTELSWLGYERAEVVGRMKFADLLGPAGVELFQREFPAFKERGWVEGLEFDLRRKDGSTFTVLLSAVAVYDAEGRYVQSRSTIFDISARKQAERELSDLNAALEKRQAEIESAYAELESFSYSVSHDLRAPLRHMDGFLELFAARVVDGLDPTSDRYLGLVRQAVKRMGALIDDLLDFSRTGRAEMRAQRVALDGIVRELRAELSLEAPGVEWRVAELPAVRGDPTLLRQMLANLLSNAVKYSRPVERPVVEIGTQPAEGEAAEIVLFVRDNGVGFDPEYTHKLFGVFQRLHGEEFEGTGIGLAIVRRVAQRHGGRAWAESTPGKGATFCIALPRAAVDAAAQIGESRETRAAGGAG